MTASSAETLYFHCHACGIRLSVPATLAGVSGPCPNCAINLVAPAFSERRTVQVKPASAAEAPRPERPEWNEFEKTEKSPDQGPVVEERSTPSSAEKQLPSEGLHKPEQKNAVEEKSSPPVVLNGVTLPPKKSQATEPHADSSASSPVSHDTQDGVEREQVWAGGNGKVQLPPKKTVAETPSVPPSNLKTLTAKNELSSAQPTKVVLPQPKENSHSAGIDSDERGRPIWRPPGEFDRPSSGFLQLPEGYEREAPRGRSRAVLIALLLILAAAGGLSYVFQDQLKLLWATYKMRDQKENAEPGFISSSRHLPAPQELSADLAVAESDVKEPSPPSSVVPEKVSPTLSTDSEPSEQTAVPPQPQVQVMGKELAALPSAVADAIVVQPRSEPIAPADEPAEAPTSQPNEAGIFIPRNTSSKRLIASGAPFAEADAWVMDAPADRVPFTRPIVLPEFLNNPPAELEEPVDVLRSFLLANSWEDRLKHVLWPDKIRPLMQLYYQKHDDGPIEVQHADVLPREPGSEEVSQQVFLLGGKDMPQPVPIMVEKTATGWKVDWAIFVEGREKLLEKFFASKSDFAAPFRVFVRRKRYFGEDVPDLENKLCYEIQPPAQGFVGHAFADKTSPLAAVLDRFLGWEVLNTAVVMELRWKSDGEGGWMEIVGLVHENWRTPKMEARLLK